MGSFDGFQDVAQVPIGFEGSCLTDGKTFGCPFKFVVNDKKYEFMLNEKPESIPVNIQNDFAKFVDIPLSLLDQQICTVILEPTKYDGSIHIYLNKEKNIKYNPKKKRFCESIFVEGEKQFELKPEIEGIDATASMFQLAAKFTQQYQNFGVTSLEELRDYAFTVRISAEHKPQALIPIYFLATLAAHGLIKFVISIKKFMQNA